MSENPLFYKKIVPLNREHHRDLRLDTGPSRFTFAAGSHLIPAVIDEFGIGGRHLPILFTPGPTVPSAVFLLGLRSGENLFVKADGTWSGDYIPAFVRRYFIIGDVPDAEPVVCIDEDDVGLRGDHGEPLFVDGEETPALKNNIRLINEYMASAKRTSAFLADLAALGLYRTITIDVRFDNRESRTLHGLMTIDIAKLEALPDAEYLSLRDKKYMPLIYAHLDSIAGIDKLRAASSIVAASSPEMAGEQLLPA